MSTDDDNDSDEADETAEDETAEDETADDEVAESEEEAEGEADDEEGEAVDDEEGEAADDEEGELAAEGESAENQTGDDAEGEAAEGEAADGEDEAADGDAAEGDAAEGEGEAADGEDVDGEVTDDVAAAGADEIEVELPEVDDSVFASHDQWEGAAPEDFEDDAGDWSDADYHETASTLFGDHDHWGDTAEQRYIDEGFTPVIDEHPVVANIRESVPDTTVRFFERDGEVVPRGFLSSLAFAALEVAFPDLDLSFLRVTVPKHPLHVESDDDVPPRPLPSVIQDVSPADSVDLRKYATPIGDQGSTSRCAAFAWTHALEMLANKRGNPFPRLACSYTMYKFQERQGDLKDFTWAYKGGDGTLGTWEPGQHLFAHGTCRHDLWPNDEKHPKASIDDLARDAEGHRIDCEVYDVTVDDMKKLLTAGLPVQISMATGDAFQDIGRDGVMKVSEAPKGQHGYHAMLCVGYAGNYFIVKNSWGEDWGDQGYCYIPKKVLAESEPEAVAIIPKRSGGSGSGPDPSRDPAPGTSPKAAAAAAVATPVAKFCIRCGAKRVDGGAFCAQCGAKHG